MSLKKFRWSKSYEASEIELEELLQAKGIDAERWMAEGGELFAPHKHPKDKRLWCSEGSIVFTSQGSQQTAMQAGDTLDIPANTQHEAVAGIMGCVCYEYPKSSDNPTLPL